MDSTKSQILVTGAAGALAQQVIARLRRHYRVVAVDFRYPAQLDDDIPSYCVDFNKRSFEDIFRQHPFDGVIHIGRILTYESTPNNRYNANVLGAQKLFDLCLKYKIAPVLVLSTFHVYGATPYNPAPLDESAPLKASNIALDLVDLVELENLATIYLWKHPELNITILRPCHIVGPSMRNSISLLLTQDIAPVLLGFSPLMQFIHMDDMADAIVLAFEKNRPGIYNVAPADWIPYQEAVAECGCVRLPLPPVPEFLPKRITKLMGTRAFPSALIDYFKYPVIINGSLFEKTFDFKPRHSLAMIFDSCRQEKDYQKLKSQLPKVAAGRH